ncbi:MAG: CPBP family intramembrane metalloprotease [Candidatus Obscuribacter sp.]|nr:CPBP family intramembrane metalloprotease [Candidatus Obscuribacter sp.]
MKFDTISTAIKSGIPAMCWAFSATLAILVAALIGYGLAWPIFYLVTTIEALKPYTPAIAEVIFTLGTTATPLVMCYLYFTGHARFITGLSQKLPTFMHLDHHLPGFPAVFGLSYRKSGISFKKIALWAIAGLVAVYGFDYLTGNLILTAPEAVNGEAPVAGGQSVEQTLTMMSGINLVISSLMMAIVAAFMEEVLFRGFVLNLWRTAFATEAASLANSSGKFGRFMHKALVYTGSTMAVVIAATLFALPHLDNLLSQFFFGLVAGFIYLQSRSVWTPVLMHVLNNSVLPVMLLVGYLSGSAAPLTGPFNASSATGTPQVQTDHGHDHKAKSESNLIPAAPAPGTVKNVTQADIDQETFNASGNVFMQICETKDCASQRAIMESLAKQFPQVEVYQADKALVPALVAILDQQIAAAAKDPSAPPQSYPLYLYANANLNVAPGNVKDEDSLKKFIETNFTEYDDAKPQAASPQQDNKFHSKLCNPQNEGAFDGKKQYDCVYDTLVNTDLALRDVTKRRTFINKFEHKYDKLGLLSDQAATTRAIAEMINDLGEMHTTFLPPDRYDDMMEGMDASLVGIGAPLTRLNQASKLKALGEYPDREAYMALQKITEDTPAVIFPAPQEGTPAALVGLKVGDRITAVNGRSNIGRTLTEVVGDIRGKAGETVELTISRPKGTTFETFPVKIVRAKVQTKEASLKMLDNGYAVISISAFGNRVSQEFSEALYQACTGKTLPADDKAVIDLAQTYNPKADCKLKGLSIDLRGNPGGRLDQVTEMMQTLMKEGTIISNIARNGDSVVEVRDSVTTTRYVREAFVDGKSVDKKEYPRMWQIVPEGTPIVAIVDSGSASASEIMSASLQVNGLATVVGQPSFGKEVGQSIIPIDFGAALKVTTFRFQPGGKPLGVAVLPDFVADDDTAYRDNPLTETDDVIDRANAVLDMGPAALAASKSAATVANKTALAEKTAKEHEVRDQKIFASLKAGNP